MFGIGFSELAIIALVLIVMIRPNDMPAFFRKMGRLYGQIKSAYKEVAAVKDEFLKEMDVAAAVQDSAATAANPAQAEASSSEPAPAAPAEPDSASAGTDSGASDAAPNLPDSPPSDPID
ncbi:MAG: Sec-independent protein translocase subunit TatA/TatB [Spirochaetales bacterium]